MALLPRLRLAIKALIQLGPGPVSQNALYRLGLATGHYRRVLNSALTRLDRYGAAEYLFLHPCLKGLPDRALLLASLGQQADELYREADEIVAGKVRLFGGLPVPLLLTPPGSLQDWSQYEKATGEDIKFTWEPSRFGWAYKLGMAYHLSRDERYAEAFWDSTELFLNSNPPYLGPNWTSPQEVAIRLMAFAFAFQALAASPHTTPARLHLLAKSIAVHAERIPPTLVYARSQNNNHLISEAVGLYTASALLPSHPLAPRWHDLGWRCFQAALRRQISPDGTYIQHSTNYHRLMLQAALWAYCIHDAAYPGEPIPADITSLLGAATIWLWKLLDVGTGRVPNLGHNDGAYILPLTASSFEDYRPVLHAAALRFLATGLAPGGAGQDMAAWLGLKDPPDQKTLPLDNWRQTASPEKLAIDPPYVLLNPVSSSWAMLRVANFRSRPAHADQLNLDLWWKGLNLARDAGTYLYNAAPPWENSLTDARVHNTIVLDDCEFMQRAGRFLYLDWAQAKVTSVQSRTPNGSVSLTAEHDGYRKMGISHSRTVSSMANGDWLITDRLLGPSGKLHTLRLSWLLPDGEYRLEETGARHTVTFHFNTPQGWVGLKVRLLSPAENDELVFTLGRAGTVILGPGPVLPTQGWFSPTYGIKVPALACLFEIKHTLPVELTSEWILPAENSAVSPRME